MKNDSSKMVCTVCTGDSFHVTVQLGINTHFHFECANPVCGESVCQGHLCKEPEFYRFKSNPKTIVKRIGPNMVQSVWTEHHENGLNNSFCYAYQPENLVPLNDTEIQAVKAKLDGKNKDECKKCGTPMDMNGFCTDETCPYSEKSQDCCPYCGSNLIGAVTGECQKCGL